MAKPEDLNFLTFVQSFRRGALIAEADDRMADLVDALEERGGKGTLTIDLSFSVNKAGQIEIVPTVKAKVPPRAIGTGIYWPHHGRLSRSDPNQADIEDYIGAHDRAAE
ncbi:hypothetical protein [Marinibacterium profundimaris]|uniref:Uncharacterized protein n=1 Tax=Marinibacterium profundimaris TaxID=1679460 RepID=A0A225NRZ2_9RHOB|nr:hypothetical protein [Marinibacterium profundimaris]OWU77615.1 hypothetical protein ATO3_02735 [Marinibacterium profundimaris]